MSFATPARLPLLPPAPFAATDGLTVSIIIPTYNEAAGIEKLLVWLQQQTIDEAGLEMLVADGGSTDDTRALARRQGAQVLRCPRKGRAAQLNHAARLARGELLYFLHADSFPPPGFLAELRQAAAQGFGSGCFRLAFDHPHWFLRFSAWCTRLPLRLVRFGDQSLFVRRGLFAQVEGFREDLHLMEDQDLVVRLQARARFRLLPRAVTTSARKYLVNGVFRLQGIFTGLAVLYWLGMPQPWLLRLYRRLVRQGKL